MYPVVVELLGVQVTSYGVSKALALLVATVLLARGLRRVGWNGDEATTVVLATAVAGFAGAKAYYLMENLDRLGPHAFGGSGFTWYGGLLAGGVTAVVLARRRGWPLLQFAAVATVPLSVAYGIGRLGCLLAGDGTTGTPTDLPWAVTITAGMVPTAGPVHPTPLYEALAAFAIAAVLWALRTHTTAAAQVGLYLVATGAARLLVEVVRTNDEVVLGLTQPQLWSLALVGAGSVLLVRSRIHSSRHQAPAVPGTASVQVGG